MSLTTARPFRHLATAIGFCLTPAVAAADGRGTEGARVVEIAAGQPVAIRFPRAAILHHFVGEMVDAAGRPIAGPVDWTTSLGTGRFTVITQLSSARSAFRIPRPFGVPVEAGDSLIVVAQMAGTADARVRVSVEYEIAESGTTRLPVRALAAAADERSADAISAEGSTAWVWTAAIGGRLVAVSAPQFSDATAIVIEEVESGAVVWRASGPSRFANAVTRLAETQRPGIVLEAGRSYRLRVERGASESSSTGAPVIMLVPRTNVDR